MIRRKVGENSEGVSPVIAVILMVAITVVLAGLVYYWIAQFSDTTDSGLAYIGYEKISYGQDWKITIEKVQGTRIPLENINLLISDENGIILHRKHISDSNPSPFASELSTIYPIAGNDSGTVISNTSLPVGVNDDFNNYIGAIFVIIDLNNDELLSTGDTIRIYGDIDGDGILDITAGDYFKVYDIPGTNEYLKCHL